MNTQIIKMTGVNDCKIKRRNIRKKDLGFFHTFDREKFKARYAHYRKNDTPHYYVVSEQ